MCVRLSFIYFVRLNHICLNSWFHLYGCWWLRVFIKKSVLEVLYILWNSAILNLIFISGKSSYFLKTLLFLLHWSRKYFVCPIVSSIVLHDLCELTPSTYHLKTGKTIWIGFNNEQFCITYEPRWYWEAERGGLLYFKKGISDRIHIARRQNFMEYYRSRWEHSSSYCLCLIIFIFNFEILLQLYLVR